MKKIIQLLFDNFGLKFFSFIVAIGVWFFVVIANKPELNFVVPVKFENVPPKMEMVSEKNHEVEVRVKGNENSLDMLSSRQIEIVVDLSNVKAGDAVFNLGHKQISLPAGLKVSRINPHQVKVKLENIVRRMVPVEPAVVGVPAEGYELKEAVVFPKTALVEGAQSKVEELKTIRTAALNITGFDTSVSRKLELMPFKDKLKYIGDASVEVRAIIAEKNEENNWLVPVQITPARWRAVIEPVSVKVVARGPISKIRALKAAEITAMVNLLELKPEQVQMDVKVQLPPDITLVHCEPDKVKVISIEKLVQDELLRPTIGNRPGGR